ncbi:hypothetical protein FWC63_01205 [Candidatus Saccharibacteria bacterium]|nr:hypothetical protein [Candidatus Saccharibacteria bacterium]
MQVVMLMWAAGLTAWVRTGYENERTLSSDAHRMRVHLIEAGILDVDGQTLVARCPWERSEENPEAICSQEWRAVIDPDYED